MDNWSKLPIRERAELINMYLDGGVMSISQMRDHYNSFGKGGYKPSQKIKDYIKKTEAFRSDWYDDSGGVQTVGYGFTGKKFQEQYPNGMTREQADKEFEKVISKFADSLAVLTPNFEKLSQNQKDALLSYIYNIGPGNYQKSRGLQDALQKEDWEGVARNINAGYNNTKLPGLRKRRDYERTLFLGDTPVSTTPSSSNQEARSSYTNVPPSFWYEAYKASAAPTTKIPEAIPERQEEKVFSSNNPLIEFTYPEESVSSSFSLPVAKRRTSRVQEAIPVPSNEEIIGDLFNRINNEENLFFIGGKKKINSTAEERKEAVANVLASAGTDFTPAVQTIQPQRETTASYPIYQEQPVNYTDEAYFTEGKILGESDKTMIKNRMAQMNTPEKVMEFQRMLRERGYNIGNSGADKDGVDGRFGAKTRAAAQQYFDSIINSRKELSDGDIVRQEDLGIPVVAPRMTLAAITPMFGVAGLMKGRAESNNSTSAELMNPLEGLSEEDIVELYTGANKHAGRSSAYTLMNHLIPGTKKARMDRATKDQLAILLANYRDKINTVDSFDELGEYGSKERTSKLSPIGYKHENALAGEKGKGVNESSTEGNALRTVLGMFGAVKDKDGNFLINDDYDNEVFRIDKEELDSNPELKAELQKMRVGKKKQKVLSSTDKEPNTYLVSREGFDLLRENGMLDNPRATLIKDLWNDVVRKDTPYSDMELNDRLRRYGENAIVRTGKATRFDFTMSDKEVNRRVRRARKKLGK